MTDEDWKRGVPKVDIVFNDVASGSHQPWWIVHSRISGDSYIGPFETYKDAENHMKNIDYVKSWTADQHEMAKLIKEMNEIARKIMIKSMTTSLFKYDPALKKVTDRCVDYNFDQLINFMGYKRK